jgi:hypothetical protein
MGAIKTRSHLEFPYKGKLTNLSAVFLALEESVAELERLKQNIKDPALDTVSKEIVGAINELFARPALPEVDWETIIRITTSAGEVLSAKAIQDTIAGAQVLITVQRIIDLMKLAESTSDEVGRIMGRGGFLSPFDFGWSGLPTTVVVGEKFSEYRGGLATEITIVPDGTGDYPAGTDIDLWDAKVMAHEFQMAVTAWAFQDIWGVDVIKYGDVNFWGTSLPAGTEISLLLDTEGWANLGNNSWQIFGTAAVGGMSFGCMISGGQVYFGWFNIVGGVPDLSTMEILGSSNDPDVSSVRLTLDRGLNIFTSEQSNNGEIYNFTNRVWVWEGDKGQIFNGTKIINAYRGDSGDDKNWYTGWHWQLTNTPDTAPAIFSWGISQLGEVNIAFATDTAGGVVRTQKSYMEGDKKVYGVSLDPLSRRMFVDELGNDVYEIGVELVRQDTQNEENFGVIDESIGIIKEDLGLDSTSDRDAFWRTLENEGWT